MELINIDGINDFIQSIQDENNRLKEFVFDVDLLFSKGEFYVHHTHDELYENVLEFIDKTKQEMKK